MTLEEMKRQALEQLAEMREYHRRAEEPLVKHLMRLEMMDPPRYLYNPATGEVKRL